jgi:hypothetical protein
MRLYARTGLAGIVSCGVLFTAVLIGRPDGDPASALVTEAGLTVAASSFATVV